MTRSVAVVGAGLAGVTTAYELAALGLKVQVFERGGSVAEQASFASSALLSPFVPDLADTAPPAPVGFRFARWRAGRKGGEAPGQLAALSQLSLARTAELRRELGLDDEASQGLLVALTDAKRVAAAEARLEGWKALGLQVELIEAGEARLREPGLNADAPLSAALALAHGGAGNARLFAQQLRLQAQRLGAEFRFHTTVRAIAADGAGLNLRHEYTPPMEAPTRGPEREAGDTLPQLLGPQDSRFDAVVLCNGLEAPALLGQRLPLSAHHETSVTAPLRLLEAHPDLGPKAAWVDPSRGLTVTRTGQRVRVTGGLTVTDVRARVTPDFETLHRGLQHWFPGSVLHQQVQQGQSRRALTADGLPLLGASGRPGLWLNLSPGGQGWGLACGSAQVLAQLIAGQAPARDIAALGPQRLA
ncbi:D-amino-acid dehydrogenase [Pelomonas saccharophila]|uniref:D-amino-acid dehydrogenase n=1 Tax=Roseateles saccharophilus TaxID=304 RepID=A0ABU1YHP9_ROSSA|nr:FAD-dependent oxidoreductase [Roseateles saccharophilus]MDR7268365.1 D-amino-acid dehydrogenase [Roseateles saccharophilus]